MIFVAEKRGSTLVQNNIFLIWTTFWFQFRSKWYLVWMNAMEKSLILACMHLQQQPRDSRDLQCFALFPLFSQHQLCISMWDTEGRKGALHSWIASAGAPLFLKQRAAECCVVKERQNDKKRARHLTSLLTAGACRSKISDDSALFEIVDFASRRRRPTSKVRQSGSF